MAVQNITINSYNLQDATIQTDKIEHEAISLDEAKLKIPRRDGSKLVSATYAERTITVTGYLVSQSASGLDGKIDDFKKNIIGAQGVNMDIDYAGTTRRYTVNVTEVMVTRDYFNITAAPYQLKVEAINPPFGQDTTTISGASMTTISGTTTGTITISGTASPKPLVRFVVNTAGTLTDIEFKNNTTSTAIKISPTSASFTSGDIVEIDTNALTVTKNGAAVAYTGTMPLFNVGNNTYQVNFYNSRVPIDQQQVLDTNTAYIISSIEAEAQQVLVGTTTTYNQIDIKVAKRGTPATDLNVAIYSDSGSNTPGSQIAATTISAANITTSSAWCSAIFASPVSLTSGTKYWIVVSAWGCTTPNDYVWAYDNANPYANGIVAYSTNNGVSWNQDTVDDHTFKLYKNLNVIDWQVGFGIQYTKWWL